MKLNEKIYIIREYGTFDIPTLKEVNPSFRAAFKNKDEAVAYLETLESIDNVNSRLTLEEGDIKSFVKYFLTL